MGKEGAIAYIGLLAILANLFISKQITLFGLNVTCSDALAVGYLLGSNLIQEFFGREVAKKAIWISFFLSALVVLLSGFHLLYQPSIEDGTHAHYMALLRPLPRITAASFFAFLVTQFLDLHFFSYLKNKMSGKFLTFRVIFCTMLAHLFDTVLFTYAGLYGTIASVGAVILVSFLIKSLVILLSVPFVMMSKRVLT